MVYLIIIIPFIGLWKLAGDMNYKDTKEDAKITRYLRIALVLVLIYGEIVLSMVIWNPSKQTSQKQVNYLSPDFKAENIFVKETDNDNYSFFVKDDDGILIPLKTEVDVLSGKSNKIIRKDSVSDVIKVKVDSTENRKIKSFKVNFIKNPFTGTSPVVGEVKDFTTVPTEIEVPMNMNLKKYQPVGVVEVNNVKNKTN